MTPKQLAIASHRVLKMLRKKPMPYKCTQLQYDTSYTIEQRLDILTYLRQHHYVREISFVDIIVTEKGRQTGGYYATRFDKWYNGLSKPVRHLLSPTSAAIVTTFCLFFYFDITREQRLHDRTWQWSKYGYSYESYDSAELSKTSWGKELWRSMKNDK